VGGKKAVIATWERKRVGNRSTLEKRRIQKCMKKKSPPGKKGRGINKKKK